ncbi:hypothetical protein Tamer19_68010 [Cupriavidus sp. TA19]|uniref:acyl-CoA dehydrogenase family protein n=1 Tax=unclassified Cupriavidus TaxID=2640874 RepID=UPI000E2F1953|nr:acyl-CoA dehydrogenase family protein [Cupriavidus sp. TA19]BDB27507.1 acyl-CoA dehydrogenase family protein [Cupriavidus sp. P-10]GLC97392.1 hypothetical protein Tamer19_68010 [Cupriavidus sp. TA19]
MNFAPDPNLAAFRQEVRDFLRQHQPADLPRRKDGLRSPRADVVRWQRILDAQGRGAPYWATEHGGTGWSVQQRLVFDEECASAGAPSQDAFAQKLVGPVLNHFATPDAEPTATAPMLPMAEVAQGMASEMFFRRATTIYGGTSEVQRSIIAKSLFQF